MDDLKRIVDDIEALFDGGGDVVPAVARRLTEVHPSDIARIMLEFDSAERKAIFDALTNEQAAEVLVETDAVSRREFLEEVEQEKLSDIVEEMPPDEGADIVEMLTPEKEAGVLKDVLDEQAESIRELIQYESDTAGGKMTTEYVAVSPDWTVDRVIEEIRNSRDLEHLSKVYVLGPDDTLVGVASLRTIVTAAAGECIGDIMDTDVVSVAVDTDQEEVARTVEQYDVDTVAVVDARGTLKGIITVDDVLDVIEEEASEDIFRHAGTAEFHPAQEKVGRRIAVRLPWLLITLTGGVVAFVTLQGAQATLARLLSIASFVPLVAACAGSVGVQTSTVIARGLATGEVRLSMVGRMLLGELAVALGIGVVCGGIAATASVLLVGEGGPVLGLIVGISMICSIGVAAVMGTVVPLGCYRLGIDPALATGPFITSANDIVGLFIYLTIARVLIGSG